MLDRLQRLARHPVQSTLRGLGKRYPRILFDHFSRVSQRQGLKKPHFILSFDCDTLEDVEVVSEVHAKLGKMGITPVYAVPGEILMKGADVYRKIAATGAEFINHGYYIHTHYHPTTKNYESIFFYDQLPPEKILEDIRLGHEAVSSVIGTAPQGFRVPHFGTFQREEHLAFLHASLKNLGYRYSTSTVPLYGLIHGPLIETLPNFFEIAVSGSYDQPSAILDSWSYRYAPVRAGAESEYKDQMEKVFKYYLSGEKKGLMNYYADPSQVHDWPDFFECMKMAAPFALPSYRKLLDLAKGR